MLTQDAITRPKPCSTGSLSIPPNRRNTPAVSAFTAWPRKPPGFVTFRIARITMKKSMFPRPATRERGEGKQGRGAAHKKFHPALGTPEAKDPSTINHQLFLNRHEKIETRMAYPALARVCDRRRRLVSHQRDGGQRPSLAHQDLGGKQSLYFASVRQTRRNEIG